MAVRAARMSVRRWWMLCMLRLYDSVGGWDVIDRDLRKIIGA